MTDTPSDPKPGVPANASAEVHSPVVLTFEDRLELFWRRNRTLIIVGCVAVLGSIIGVGVWEHFAKQKELEIREVYAKATTPEALKTFADTYAGHPLAGAAYLRMADDAFAAGKPADAISNYEKAGSVFKEGPLAARVKLGTAVAKVVGGKASEGTAELKRFAEDANQFKGLRAEAAYHLASLAAEAGVSADVMKYTDLIMQVDPSSPWMQRGMVLRASLPPTAAVPEAKADGASPGAPSIQIAPTK